VVTSRSDAISVCIVSDSADASARAVDSARRQTIPLDVVVGLDLVAAVSSSSGRVVILLDPADELLPSAGELVRHAFGHDQVVHVQWPQIARLADGAQRVLPEGLLSTGDLVPRLRSGGVETCAFGLRSGHAFRRDFLEEALRLIDPTDERAHLTLSLMAPAAGRVAALYEPQAIGPDVPVRVVPDLFDQARGEAAELDARLEVAAEFWQRTGVHLPVDHLRAVSTPHRVSRALDDIEHTVPIGTPYAIVDDDLWRAALRARGHAAEPFPHHDGVYWGPPVDDAEALAELAAAQARGVHRLVVTWPCFWWLDIYASWSTALTGVHRTVARTTETVVFALGEMPEPSGTSPRPQPRKVTRPHPRPDLDTATATRATDHLITALGDSYVSALAELATPGTPCALIDFPDHANVGDSAIWLGERLALQRACLQPAYVCTMEDYDSSALRAAVGEGAVIFLHGGGNLGDLYPAHQRFRERVAADFPRNRIVQLPQTVNFRRRANAERARSVFNAHSDFTLMVRDRASHELATMLFERPPMLCPDAAFVLGSLPRPTSAVMPFRWLARTDFESGAGIAAAAGSETVDWLEADESDASTARRWWTPYDEYLLSDWDDRALAHVYRGARLLAEAQVVITDRLHGHILSMLLHIPHVLLNDAYSKVRDFHEAWTASSGLALAAETPEEALELGRHLLGMAAPVRPGSVDA
jgi:exopolysaccharide biosynthesis predicted pyruvyltransferase EpsI